MKMTTEKLFIAIAGHLRAMQLDYHEAHHLASGPCFAADHDMFGEFYAEVEGDFDSFVERCVGMGKTGVAGPYNQTDVIMKVLGLDHAEAEIQLCALIDLAVKVPEMTLGFEQLLGDIAQRSEVRSYKLGRRAL
jgi:DNA-binding ferritin-like protein